MSRLPSLASDQSAVQAEHCINGSDQRDTGHLIWSTQPAAKAEQETFHPINLNFRF